MPGQGARMKAGNLVRLRRAKIGLPAGSLGLLVKKEKQRSETDFNIWTVKFVCKEYTRRFLGRDLEVVSS
jgi:hypothetical protein